MTFPEKMIFRLDGKDKRVKLTDEDVKDILYRTMVMGQSLVDVAGFYNVHSTTVSCIYTGKTWGHISREAYIPLIGNLFSKKKLGRPPVFKNPVKKSAACESKDDVNIRNPIQRDLPDDLKRKVKTKLNCGYTIDECMVIFGLARSTVYNIKVAFSG